ncbi:hypothetical protein Vretifemale_18087 [Volvox reticuliferus]|uniref:Uncharacterized protein n=1 Tax=Volvox reticuliferus TaxID=1737510 RepID=A0A8J4D0F3_9CHLO|nr:hypothetical protein Vretifemale_18087 [Volvox reticuliferus]
MAFIDRGANIYRTTSFMYLWLFLKIFINPYRIFLFHKQQPWKPGGGDEIYAAMDICSNLGGRCLAGSQCSWQVIFCPGLGQGCNEGVTAGGCIVWGWVLQKHMEQWELLLMEMGRGSDNALGQGARVRLYKMVAGDRGEVEW